jgi:hypothetical protein
MTVSYFFLVELIQLMCCLCRLGHIFRLFFQLRGVADASKKKIADGCRWDNGLQL